MKKTSILYVVLVLMMSAYALPGGLYAQDGDGSDGSAAEGADKPDQLDIFKIHLTQFAVNEARVLYEMEIAKTASLEFGVGYIYPNPFWLPRSTTQVLGTGAAVFFSFRKYFDKKRYIYQPVLRSYLSPSFFFKHSTYENEWLLFQGADPAGSDSQCELFSETLDQIGTTVRFGWQTRAGRVAIDFYSGIGVKFIFSNLTSHAINDSSMVCEPISTTIFGDVNQKNFSADIILQAGVKLGLRRNNRERNYKEKENGREEEMENPPEFRP